jgi:hypothetical protein
LLAWPYGADRACCGSRPSLGPYYRNPVEFQPVYWSGAYVGVEPWGSNFLVRAEYLNYNFNGALVGPFGASNLSLNEVRTGFAYKF